jgi:phosphonopyruvate decarboxylase
MISCEALFDVFRKNDITFFSGVPDSTFKDWMTYLAGNHGEKLTNIMACNECEAVALAAGHHLATGKIGVVYMQNSGEGKAVNPLTSLCDPEVYSIPLIMMIGWRGEPGKADEPQHKKMGRITIPLLETLEVPFQVMPDEIKKAERTATNLIKAARERGGPVALIIRSNTFDKYVAERSAGEDSAGEASLTREEAIRVIVDNLAGDEIIVSTTGKTSRELFELRVRRGEDARDFYTVGSMGCAISIANGIALSRRNKRVVVFDGDGAVLMQMGSLATVGYYHPQNLYHVVYDNMSYDSTGGQPTTSPKVDFAKIALACNYKSAVTVSSEEELKAETDRLKRIAGPHLVIVKVKQGSRKDLGRPTKTPIENKEEFSLQLRQ